MLWIKIQVSVMYNVSPYLSDAINHNLVQSEIEGGVCLHEVPSETVLEVRTQNHLYTIVHKGAGQALISGHPEFCPEPLLVQIHGSTWGGSMLKTFYIGRGMRLEFQPPECLTITTSPVLEIREQAAGSAARVPCTAGVD
ncbi:MAG TPA: hypothetical protein VE959_04815 [Bryobacteraceae bacterium]|nr:hypothetical protein [Bryobacteraceae bacterium]